MNAINPVISDCIDWIYYEQNQLNHNCNNLQRRGLELIEAGNVTVVEFPFPDTNIPKYIRAFGNQILFNTNVGEHTPSSNIQQEFEIALLQIGRFNVS